MPPAAADGQRAHAGFGLIALFYGIMIVALFSALFKRAYPDRSKAVVVNFLTLVLRVVAGLGVAVLAGWPKFANAALFEKFMVTVGTLMIPVISNPMSTRMYAGLAVAAELGGGVALALGLFTRACALALAFTHLVALYAHLVVWGDDPVVVMSVGGAYGAGCFVYEIVWIWFLVNGAGPTSLDAALARLMGGGRRAPAAAAAAKAAKAAAPGAKGRRDSKKSR